MKIASGLFGIIAAILMVAGMFCGAASSTCAGLGTAMDETKTLSEQNAAAERTGALLGSQLACLTFLVPVAALLSLVGGIVAFAKVRVGGALQLAAFVCLVGTYSAVTVFAGKVAGTEGVALSVMNILFGAVAPAILSFLGALFGLLAGRQHGADAPRAAATS